MRCRLIVLCVLLFSMLLFSPALQAQTRQDALRAFETLQSRCETGLNYDAYASALDEAQGELTEFFNSKESQKNHELSDKIERALIAHQSALAIWDAKLAYRQDFVRSDHPTIQMLLDTCPDAAALFNQNGEANVGSLVSFFWDKADARITEAKKMTSGKSKR